MQPRPIPMIAAAIVMLLVVSTAMAAGNDPRVVEAAKRRDHAAVRALINDRVDVNSTESDGSTALLWAAQWDDETTAGALILAGANANAANALGVTPLWMACSNGSVAMVERLLRAGANPNLALPTGETPLMRAALTGRPAVVNALLRQQVDIDARESRLGQTALMWAISEGHLEVARVLLAKGAKATLRSKSGFSPLMFAARQGRLDFAELLLAHGADVNEKTLDGTSVLLVATVRGHSAFARHLLEKGADPNADGTGYTPLHWAVSKWESMTTYEYVVESGEWGALGGVPSGKLELVQALLAHGANPNAKLVKSPPRFGYHFEATAAGPEIGATPFFLAARSSEVDIMRALVAAGADPLLPTDVGTTPLMAAAGLATVEDATRIPESHHLEAVKLCIELGIALDATTNKGDTALHGAAYVGFSNVARLLVERGAPINAKNKKGETPRKVADGVVVGVTFYTHKATADVLGELGGSLQ